MTAASDISCESATFSELRIAEGWSAAIVRGLQMPVEP